MENLINLETHKRKLEAKAQELKNIYAVRSQTEQYLRALSELFLEDIQQIANNAYEKAILETKNKITPIELEKSFKKTIQLLFEAYSDLMNSYNVGNMFSHTDRFERICNLFTQQRDQLIEEQGHLISSKYSEKLKEKRNNMIMLIAAIIAAVAGLIAAFPVLSDLF